MEKQSQTIVHKHYYFRWIVQFVCGDVIDET